MGSDRGGLTVEEGRVRLGDLELRLAFPVADARRVGERIVVLYDYMSGPTSRQFQNVEAFGPSGERLWTAQHPTNETADAYVRFLSVEPLRLSSFVGFDCELDPRTGRLLHSVFTR